MGRSRRSHVSRRSRGARMGTGTAPAPVPAPAPEPEAKGPLWPARVHGALLGLLATLMVAVCLAMASGVFDVGMPDADASDAASPGAASTQALSTQGASTDDAASPAPLTVYFLSVGQGDSELVVLPDGTTFLIDAGDADGGRVVVDYLTRELGLSRIDYLVATHPESDHIGGMAAVLRSDLEIGGVVAPEVSNDTSTYERFLAAVADRGLSITSAWAGLALYDQGGCRVEVLSPSLEASPSYKDVNDWSAVLKVTYGETSFLFMGDASYKVVEALGVGHVDVLKVGHHGSNTAVSIPLLLAITPSIGVIEVGAGNSYGLPTQESLDELGYCDVQVWRTDLDGTVEVTSDGSAIGVRSRDTGSAQPVDPDASPAVPVADAPGEGEPGAGPESGTGAGGGVDGGAASGDVAANGNIELSGRTVYITDTGEKYHAEGCRYLAESSIAVDEAQAVAWGYAPCSVCGG